MNIPFWRLSENALLPFGRLTAMIEPSNRVMHIAVYALGNP